MRTTTKSTTNNNDSAIIAQREMSINGIENVFVQVITKQAINWNVPPSPQDTSTQTKDKKRQKIIIIMLSSVHRWGSNVSMLELYFFLSKIVQVGKFMELLSWIYTQILFFRCNKNMNIIKLANERNSLGFLEKKKTNNKNPQILWKFEQSLIYKWLNDERVEIFSI